MRAVPIQALRTFVVGLIAVATTGMANSGDRIPTPAPLPAREEAAAIEPESPSDDAAPLPRPAREPSALTPRLRARGYNACFVPENGFGSYTQWERVGRGWMILPRDAIRTHDGGYDVVVHFHGHEAVRHAFVEVAERTVLVGVDLGSTSVPYDRVFARPEAFTRLLEQVTLGLAQKSGDARAHIRHLALSSWSAGSGAVRRIVSQFGTRIEAVILLDSLHSDYEPGPPRRISLSPIAGVAAFAERATRGEAMLFLSHSQIVPPGYPSTTEIADQLIASVGGTRTPRQGMNALGAELVSGFDRGGMHVRGYLGGDKAAHCAHVELLAEAVRDYLEPAWARGDR